MTEPVAVTEAQGRYLAYLDRAGFASPRTAASALYGSKTRGSGLPAIKKMNISLEELGLIRRREDPRRPSWTQDHSRERTEVPYSIVAANKSGRTVQRKLKVWSGWTIASGPLRQALGTSHSQVGFVLAARSQKEAAEALGTGLGHIRDYCSPSANEPDTALAQEYPGVPIYRRMDHGLGSDYVAVIDGAVTVVRKAES